MAGVPFKVCIPSRKLQVGVVAKSYKHFLEVVQAKFGFAPHAIQLSLDDGTLICDQDYFELLEPQTKVTVSEESTEEQPKQHLGDKRPLVVAPADSATSIPPPKRARPTTADGASSPPDARAFGSNTNNNSSNVLASCLKIDSVIGSVPMQLSPSPTRSSPSVSSVASPRPQDVTRTFQPLTHCVQVPDLQRSARAYQLSGSSPLSATRTFQQSAQCNTVPSQAGLHGPTVLQHHFQYGYTPTEARRQPLISPPPMRYHGLPHAHTQQHSRAYPTLQSQPLQHFSPPVIVRPQVGTLPQSPADGLNVLPPLKSPHQYQLYHAHQSALLARRQMQPTQPSTPPSTAPLRVTQQQMAELMQQRHAHAVQKQSQALGHQPGHQPARVHCQKVATITQHTVSSAKSAETLRQATAAVQIPYPSVIQLPRPPPPMLLDMQEHLPAATSTVTSTLAPMECATRVSVVSVETLPPSGDETEDEDERLAIAENVSEPSTPLSASNSQPASPAFFPPLKSQPVSRPSSLTLHSVTCPSEVRGDSPADAIIIDESPEPKEVKPLAKTLKAPVPQQRDSSPDDGYCTSSPPPSATELSATLPFANYNFSDTSTQVDHQEKTQAEGTPQAEIMPWKQSGLEEAESELLTFAKSKTPTKAAPLPELMVTIPMNDGQVKGYAHEQTTSELHIRIPVAVTGNGGILCHGLSAAEEDENLDDSLVEATFPQSPPYLQSPDHDGQELGGCLEDAGVESEEPVIVQDHALEELVHTVTQICSEAILKECVDEIISLAERLLEEPQTTANSEGDFMPLLHDSVLVDSVVVCDGDIVNEVTVSDSEDDDEWNTADLIKEEMKMSSIREAEERKMESPVETKVKEPMVFSAVRDIGASVTEQSRISERVEKILCLAEQLSPRESKIIREFFQGTSAEVAASGGKEWFVLKRVDDRQINLELDYQTGEWRGYITPTTCS